ncbi:unnamed protein product [Peronospora belbahrii]|uniref:C2H2-type domain-containing protein n=1 Tax=Peronospora belbahrii TaxID=622444 RepID=A0AAU9KMG9_9STRA|nr:unnamed protein product [Peronospora belbahrii]CAH0518639.1 unnamed protein product [Peronospora belbahrii]
MSSQREESTSRLEWQQRHRQTLQNTVESVHIGRATAHMLCMQAEQLSCTEHVVDETQATVDMSKRVLRGMTWSGWFYNKLLMFPQYSTNKEPEKIVMGFICPECKVKFESPEQLGMHYDSIHEKKGEISVNGGAKHCKSQLLQDASQIGGNSMANDIHDQFIRDLEPQLAQLKEQSLAIGDALDMQNEQLDRLDLKIGQVHQDMKKVGIQVTRFTGRKTSLVFRFRCAFQEVQSKRFLRDEHGEAVLGAGVVVDGCAFRAYTLGDDDDVWGFQSEKSSYFLGINRYGNLKVRGADLNSYEQFLIECKPSTPLFSLSSYLGFGGWIALKGSRSSNNLTIIRGSPENKSSAAYFRIINLDDGMK